MATAEIHSLTHADEAGTTTAVIVPAWGANILGFAFHPRALMWPVSFLETVDLASIACKPTSHGVPLLAPTPGRIGARDPGRFRFDGREYRLAQPRHGFFRNLPWAVAARTASSITCVLDVRPSESLGTFPFELRAEYHVTLSSGRLDAHLAVTATGDDQPVSVGWHPYLHREPGSRLTLPASSFWELDDSPEPVPTGRIVPVEGRSDFRHGRVIAPEEHWDLTLTDLASEGGRAICALESESFALTKEGAAVKLAVRRMVESDPARIANIQLYTAPGRPALAVEPFSSPPDAVNLLAAGGERTGVQRLRRGETASFEISLAVGTAAV